MRRYAAGEYVRLYWDHDGDPSAHYVAGHVTAEEFRVELARWFAGDRRRPTIPAEALIKHVYVRSVRVENDGYDNRAYEWRHCSPERRGAMAMTYWEIQPHRGVGA